MLYAVGFLGALCIVEAVKGANKIACDTADTLKGDLLLPAVAAGALVVDYSGVAAARVAVDRVVDCAVADTLLLHAADDLLERVEILERIAVKLDVADVTAVGEGVIGRLQLDLAERADVVVYRDMEGVRVVIPVGDSGISP